MITFRPQSILHLTIVGFLAVTATLVVALVLTARKLDGLSMESQRIVNTATQAMIYSRELIEQASAMERNIRQYEIVGGQEILDVYNDRRRRLVQVIESLRVLALSADLDTTLDNLIEDESRLFTAISENRVAQITPRRLNELLRVAELASGQITTWNYSRLAELREDTDYTKKLLTWQAVILVFCALVMAAIFTALITRPLLQLERAIKHIGDGSAEGPIRVSGPRDLVTLGERLEWLRLRFEKLEERRSLFLRHISHELKTPLASMQESASLLKDGVVGPMTDEQVRLLDIQIKNSKRLLGLIDDLIRHNSERFSLLNVPPETVRLDKLLDKVINDNEPQLKNLKITVKREGTPSPIKGNPEHLRVVLDNLVTNAIRYSPQSGEISVYFTNTENSTQVDITDQGPGIPEDEVEDIFIPFFQGANTGPGQQSANTGLGLAITREYTQSNGGSISVVERSGGAHFRLVFPRTAQGRTHE